MANTHYFSTSLPFHQADKDAVVDLSKYIDGKVRVRFQGGREVEGILKGFDKLDNLVLDDSIEFLRGFIHLDLFENKTHFHIKSLFSITFRFPLEPIADSNDPYTITEETRKLG